MVEKVAYVLDSEINPDIAYKIASPSATIAFVGNYSSHQKLPLSIAFGKSITTVCISNGYLNSEPAINMLANKAINLTAFKHKPVKLNKAEGEIMIMLDAFDHQKNDGSLLVDMLDI